MSSRRLLKAAAAIREVVSMAILTELRDPRVRDVTVTQVEVAPDMRSAKIHVSIMGNEAKQNLSLRGLQNAAGFLQQKIADGIDTRYTPRLQFVLDKGVKNSIAISRILNEVLPAEAAAAEVAESDVEDADDEALQAEEADAPDSDPGGDDHADAAADEPHSEADDPGDDDSLEPPPR